MANVFDCEARQARERDGKVNRERSDCGRKGGQGRQFFVRGGGGRHRSRRFFYSLKRSREMGGAMLVVMMMMMMETAKENWARPSTARPER